MTELNENDFVSAQEEFIRFLRRIYVREAKRKLPKEFKVRSSCTIDSDGNYVVDVKTKVPQPVEFISVDIVLEKNKQ